MRAARYLTQQAWDPAASTFPFEPGSDRAYFFDIGIIVRGLLAVWRATGEEEFRARAQEAALSMAFDFLGEGVFHPVISLPDKQPLPPEPHHASRWSRKPGCYQLKAALAWREMGDAHAAQVFDAAVASALANHEQFLAEETDREKLMDRLHAYCYFLEALLFTSERQALHSGMGRAARLLREIQPVFERSDVNAQLLRVRLIADHLGLVPLDEEAAREEAARAASFQAWTRAIRACAAASGSDARARRCCPSRIPCRRRSACRRSRCGTIIRRGAGASNSRNLFEQTTGSEGSVCFGVGTRGRAGDRAVPGYFPGASPGGGL